MGQTVIDYCYLQGYLRNVVFVAGHITAFNKSVSFLHEEEDDGES